MNRIIVYLTQIVVIGAITGVILVAVLISSYLLEIITYLLLLSMFLFIILAIAVKHPKKLEAEVVHGCCGCGKPIHDSNSYDIGPGCVYCKQCMNEYPLKRDQ